MANDWQSSNNFALPQDEDEALKQALALSLVTAKEDEKRRKERYSAEKFASAPGLYDASPLPGSSNIGSQSSQSLISRPRPQPSQFSSSAGASQIAGPPKPCRGPVIPPRPDHTFTESLPPRPKKISQSILDTIVLPPNESDDTRRSEKTSIAQLDHGAALWVPPPPCNVPRNRKTTANIPDIVNTPSNRHLLPSNRSQSTPPMGANQSFVQQASPNIPRRPSPAELHTTTAPAAYQPTDRPLIELSPKSVDPLDFDLDSLDPLKDGPKISFPPQQRKPSPQLTAARNMSSYTGSQNNLLGLGPDFPPHRSASTGALPKTETKGNNLYSTHIHTAAPVPPPRPDHTFVQTPVVPPRPDQSLLQSKPSQQSSNSSSPKFNPKSLNAPVSVTNKAILSASGSLVSDMSMTKNPAYGTIDPSVFLMRSTPGSKKLDTPDSNWLIPSTSKSAAKETTGNRASEQSVESEDSHTYTIPDGAMIFHKPQPGDLMDFSDSRQTYYLSLESFDPLFSMERSVGSMERSVGSDGMEMTDSIGLFPNPLDRLQRKNTPNPFPTINTVTTQTLMRKSLCDINSAPAYENVNIKDKNEMSKTDSKPSDQYEELQDPFSVPDLLAALERKRQLHAKEQLARQAALKKEQKEVEEVARNLERSKPPVEESSILRQPGHARSFSRSSSYIQQGEESSYEILHDFPETADEEIQAFCSMVAGIKMMYRNTEESTNPGVVISPRCKHPLYKSLTVKLMVKAPFIEDPGFPFTCDVNSTVSHVIGAVFLSAGDNLGNATIDDFVLKVHGLSEYLMNDTCLADYAYVQECMKLDVDIKFMLVENKKMVKPFKRTPEDDRNALFVPKPREVADKGMRITKDKLNILMETFYKEVEKLRDNAIQNGLQRVQCKSVIQSVKAICAVVHKMESIDILRAIQRLQSVNLEKTLQPASSQDLDAYAYVTKDGSGIIHVRDSENVRRVSDLDDLHIALEEMTMAVKVMIELYCRTFHTDFRFKSTTKLVRDVKDGNEAKENLIVQIASVFRIPQKVKNTFQEFKIMCGLYYGGQKLVPEVMTQSQPLYSPIFGDTLTWDEWVMFESVMLCNLPREARLCFTLVGVKVVQPSGSEPGQKVNSPLGWVGLQLYNHDFKLTQGSQLLGLWPGDLANPTGTSISNTEMPHSILIQVNMPQFDCDYVFPHVKEQLPSVQQDFECLHPSDQEVVEYILERDSITSLTEDEGEFLWEKRHFLYDRPEALARVIQQIGSWYWGSLTETYSMVCEWVPLAPEQALELLLPQYPDTFIRDKGAEWLSDTSTDELCDYLPQLVQALKFESYHTSALASLILEKSICSVRVAHDVYWLLKEAADDVCYRKRYQLMFGALLSVVGEGMRKELAKEEDVVKMFSAIAEKVKAAKEKEAVLSRELYNMWDFLQFESVRLPLNPGMEVSGIDVKSCSYFTSFTFPLKLVLKNIDSKADSHYAMFKVGDDLRQDMLTMQIIDVMDKIWLKEGMDLKMVTFRCVHTGIKKGLVEIITESETLRRIQTKHGVAGSFKDRPIAEWLQLQNPTELEYQKACDNFTASCAGYCVATYVLGIGDRHNDNIMIKQSGHMFHIDFAKFLGDSQMFGSIKRDRVPFVLTSDMAYVINGGDKQVGPKFQRFVDLCCQSFNIIRRHGNLFINLLSMMALSGIPGVSVHAAKYVQKALLPDSSDAEATAVFTRILV